MSEKNRPEPGKGPIAGKALELVMRDVLAGMSELANIAAFDPGPGDTQVPDGLPGRRDPRLAVVLRHPAAARRQAARRDAPRSPALERARH